MKRTWTARLQTVYKNFEEFEAYSMIYGLAHRLGYKNAVEAWADNPQVRGSIDPKDYKKVRTK